MHLFVGGRGLMPIQGFHTVLFPTQNIADARAIDKFIFVFEWKWSLVDPSNYILVRGMFRKHRLQRKGDPTPV